MAIDKPAQLVPIKANSLCFPYNLRLSISSSHSYKELSLSKSTDEVRSSANYKQQIIRKKNIQSVSFYFYSTTNKNM